MNEPKTSANGDPPTEDDDDDAATKVSELPSDLVLEPPPSSSVIEPAPEDVELVAPTPVPPPPEPPPPQPPLGHHGSLAGSPHAVAPRPVPAPPPPRSTTPMAPTRTPAPESVQIRGPNAALSGEDVDVHGDTRLNQVPADPANAADAARFAQAGGAHAVPLPPAPPAPMQNASNPPPFGVVPQHPQHGQHSQHPQPPQHAQPQHGYDASPFAATAYANAQQPSGQHRQGAPGGVGASAFTGGPPAPVAVQAKFAPPYAAPQARGPASGVVWAVGGILVGLVLLAIIAFVLFWLLRSGAPAGSSAPQPQSQSGELHLERPRKPA